MYDGTLPDGVEYQGSSLTLESGTTIRHYFSGDLTNARLTVNGVVLDSGEIKKDGNRSYIEITNIAAPDLDKAYVVSLTTYNNGNIATDFVINYSVLSYCQRALYGEKNVDKALKDLANSIYKYWFAAENYQYKYV